MNKKQRKIATIAVTVMLISAFVIMLHQWIVWGDIWSIEQTLHHETFALVLVSIAIGMLIMLAITRRK
jgi:hypothetical protein